MIALSSPLQRHGLKAVIADARRRQRNRRTVLAVVLAAASVLVVMRFESTTGPATPAARQSAAVPLPAVCGLLTDALVARIFEGRMAYKTGQSVGHSCTWGGFPFPHQFGQERIDVAIAPITDAEFATSASYSLVPGQTSDSLVRKGSQPIRRLGDSAYWDAHTSELDVLYDGTVIYVDGILLAHPFIQEETIARTVIARLKQQRSET